ncbi:MAG: HEAT repeat domain-containing protein [Anaerolineae bacterium]|jgi:HEAT repeat protein|nr:HEAT repeat domain-containing protein [Anaerolineae bacterium]
MGKSQITGREPRLASGYTKKGERRLSLRHLGTMLNLLPPEAVSLDALAAAVHNEEFFVRFNAAKLLSRRADRDSRLILQDVLDNGDVPARASVARHLYGFSWFAAEPLIRKALKDKDYRVREAAIYALCDLRELNAYQLMVEVLKNEEDDVRAAAAWGLRDCQDSAAVPVLEVVLQAQDPEVRIKALEALGANDTPEAMPVVRDAMNDPEPEVKYAATLSLLELSGERWLQELSGIIGRTSGVTLQQVLRGFFHATNYLKIDVGRTKAADLMIDALETALLDTMPEVRRAVIWPLAWMRHARTPQILRKSYNIELDSEVKAEIVRISTSLMSSLTGANSEELAAADYILQDALQSQDPKIKTAAEEALRNREFAASGKT